MIPLIEIFCLIDDFCKYFGKAGINYILPNHERKRQRPCTMSFAEIITIGF